SPGKITRLRLPHGPGVRDDGGIYEGAEVSIYYDPMISKLAVLGRDREEAIGRMQRALEEYDVAGIKTTLPFFREIMSDPELIEGRVDTGFIPRFNERKQEESISTEERDIALAAAALSFAKNTVGSPSAATHRSSRWAEAARLAALSYKK